LLGCDSDISYKIINSFYSKIYNSKIIKKTSLREGEIAKISINSYITSKISFSNYISELCEKSDETDAAKVLDVIGQDKRINHSYLKIGTKFSGPCFPRDNLALANYSKKKGVNSLIPEKNDKVNKLQTKRLFSILKKISKKNKRVNIGICGMTYKNHTNIIKDSQGYDLLNLIKKSNLKNNSILLYDNYLNSNDIKISKNMTLCTDKKNFIKKADIIFLMYNIKNLGLENYKTKKKKYIVDCWRIYKKLPKYLIKIDLGKYSKFL